MKLTIDVSRNSEATSAPWWMIINPKQNMSIQIDACHNIASMITGPFFSRESAQTHLDLRRHAFGPNAVVFCHSGYWSNEYKDAYREALKQEQKSKPNVIENFELEGVSISIVKTADDEKTKDPKCPK